MNINDAKNFFINVSKNNPKALNKLTRNNIELMDFLKSELKNIDFEKSKTVEYRYWILNNIRNYPRCKNCGNIVTKFNMDKNRYYDYCCHYCSTQDPKLIDKKSKIFLEKYGVKSAVDIPHVRKSVHSESAKKKYVQTCLKHFGVTNPNKNKNVRDKYTDTMKRLYGGVLWESEILKEKSKKTNLLKFGCSCYAYHKYHDYNPKHYYFDGRYFDSSYEIFYYIYLKKKNVNFIYQYKIPEYYICDNEKHYCYIDFYLCDYHKYIETKGSYFLNKDKSLHNPFKNGKDNLYLEKYKLYRKYNVIILSEKELEKLGYKSNNIKYYRKYCNFCKENNIKYFCDIRNINLYNYDMIIKETLEKGVKCDKC